jgi:hypothetical protein
MFHTLTRGARYTVGSLKPTSVWPVFIRVHRRSSAANMGFGFRAAGPPGSKSKPQYFSKRFPNQEFACGSSFVYVPYFNSRRSVHCRQPKADFRLACFLSAFIGVHPRPIWVLVFAHPARLVHRANRSAFSKRFSKSVSLEFACGSSFAYVPCFNSRRSVHCRQPKADFRLACFLSAFIGVHPRPIWVLVFAHPARLVHRANRSTLVSAFQTSSL